MKKLCELLYCGETLMWKTLKIVINFLFPWSFSSPTDRFRSYIHRKSLSIQKILPAVAFFFIKILLNKWILNIPLAKIDDWLKKMNGETIFYQWMYLTGQKVIFRIVHLINRPGNCEEEKVAKELQKQHIWHGLSIDCESMSLTM